MSLDRPAGAFPVGAANQMPRLLYLLDSRSRLLHHNCRWTTPSNRILAVVTMFPSVAIPLRRALPYDNVSKARASICQYVAS